MRHIFLTVAAISASILGASLDANAASRIAGSTPSPYTCAKSDLSRVALSLNPDVPCCAGQFGCPQLLSNTGLLKPKRDNHT